MVARVCFNLFILSLLRLAWVIEQPSSSLLENHPLFEWLCGKIKVYKVPRTNSLQCCNCKLC